MHIQSLIIILYALMVLFVLLEELLNVKGELRYVTRISGDLYVIMDGESLTAELSVDSWAFMLQVFHLTLKFSC